MQLGPGTTVTPNVRLVRELGRGGMGSVWVADHLTLDTQVAAPGGTDRSEAAKAGCQIREAPSAGRGRDAIRTTVREQFSRFRRCYDSARDRNVQLSGKVAVAFDLTPDGDVFGARIADTTVGDTVFQQCVMSVFRDLRFSPPFKGGADIVYPIEFTPGP